MPRLQSFTDTPASPRPHRAAQQILPQQAPMRPFISRFVQRLPLNPLRPKTVKFQGVFLHPIDAHPRRHFWLFRRACLHAKSWVSSSHTKRSATYVNSPFQTFPVASIWFNPTATENTACTSKPLHLLSSQQLVLQWAYSPGTSHYLPMYWQSDPDFHFILTVPTTSRFVTFFAAFTFHPRAISLRLVHLAVLSDVHSFVQYENDYLEITITDLPTIQLQLWQKWFSPILSLSQLLFFMHPAHCHTQPRPKLGTFPIIPHVFTLTTVKQ